MKAPDRTWRGALLLGFLLGSIHFASFSMPVMSMPPHQAMEVSWNGLDAIGYLNGWQICKYFYNTSGNVLLYSGFANPAFWLGVILLALGRWWGATFAGCVALGLAVAGFFFVCNLGPHRPSVSNVLIGYYVWLFGMVALTIASLIGALLQRRHSEEAERLEAINAEQ